MAEYETREIVYQAIHEPGELHGGQDYIVVSVDKKRNIYKIKGTVDGDIRLFTRQNLDTFFRKGSRYRGH